MDMMDLRILVELFEHRSISKVAKNLPLSYSAVNARLANIESEVRVSLFIRTKRGTELTDAGKRFYYFAYQSLLSLETGLGVVRKEDSRSKEQEFRIGVTRPLVHIVAPVFSELMQENKSFGNWNIQTGFSIELMLLTNGEALHMSIINQNKYIPQGLEQIEIFEDDIYLVGPKGKRLPDYDNIYHVLERIPLILLKKGFPIRDLIEEEFFRPMGFIPKQVIEVDSMDMVKQLILQGVGFSFIPMIALFDYESSTSQSNLAIYSHPLLTQKFHLIYSSTFSQSHGQLLEDTLHRIQKRVKTYREINKPPLIEQRI